MAAAITVAAVQHRWQWGWLGQGTGSRAALSASAWQLGGEWPEEGVVPHLCNARVVDACGHWQHALVGADTDCLSVSDMVDGV